MEHVDVLIVGAGLSGIGAACHLRRDCPDKTYAILEARDAIGGTWDLFRYPGHPLGLGHVHPRLLVPAVDRTRRPSPTATSIRDYVARDRPRVRRRRARSASATGSLRAEWSSATRPLDGARRSATDTGETVDADLLVPVRLLRLLPLRRGLHARRSPGADDFAGHGRAPAALARRTSTTPASGWSSSAAAPPPSPWCRRWPSEAAHVTMLQRSPTLRRCRCPSRDPLADAAARAGCRRRRRTRWCAGRTCCSASRIFQLSRRRPRLVKALLRQARASASCRPGYDVDTHFTPALRPVGPAAVRGPRRRPVHGHPRRAGPSIVTDRIDDASPRRGLRLRLRRRARRRHRGHRDRAQPAGRSAA